jgi:hypothetical protein
MIAHLSELIVAIITMLGSLATVYLKHMLEESKKAKQDPIRENHNHNTLLYTKLAEVRSAMDADRAYIIQYHNGSYYKSGQSMLKFSMTHEVVAAGIGSEMGNTQSLPISMFNSVFDQFYKDGYFIIENVDHPDVNQLAKLYYKKRGVQSVYAYPVKNLHGHFIGAVMVNFVKDPVSLSYEHCALLEQTAALVSGYLRG